MACHEASNKMPYSCWMHKVKIIFLPKNLGPDRVFKVLSPQDIPGTDDIAGARLTEWHVSLGIYF